MWFLKKTNGIMLAEICGKSCVMIFYGIGEVQIMRFFILREADIWSTMLKTILEYEE